MGRMIGVMTRLSCTGCGACCTFTNGAPFIFPVDVNAWLKHDQWRVLNQIRFTIDENTRTQEWTFWEKPNTHECVFRINGKCAIYRIRPLACQVYPGTERDTTCVAGVKHPLPSKHVMRQYIKAAKDWRKWSMTTRQAEMKRVIKLAREH